MPAKNYARLLSDNSHVDHFLRTAIQFDDENLPPPLKAKEMNTSSLTLRICAAEKQLIQSSGKDTLTHKDDRMYPYLENSHRKDLRRRIYTELIQKQRLADDEKIKLGEGGALPNTTLKKERQAFYIIGLPASGKSQISNLISDEFGAMILDSDYAKRKFPEFNSDFGAAIVHEESSVVVFGGQGEFSSEPSVLQYAVKNGCNIIIPKIGDVSSKVDELAKNLIEVGYQVHLILVRLDRRKAIERACCRFIDTGRYVSLSLIFDVYSNDPTIRTCIHKEKRTW